MLENQKKKYLYTYTIQRPSEKIQTKEADNGNDNPQPS